MVCLLHFVTMVTHPNVSGKNIPLDWDDNITLLAIDIDNRLENLDQNFEKVHAKTDSLFNGWNAESYQWKEGLTFQNASWSVSIPTLHQF